MGRVIRSSSLASVRTQLQRATDVVLLCGAGISLIAPTSLPDGNTLRDICVRALLSDAKTEHVINEILASRAYRELLPEAVLQLIGSTVGKPLDYFIAILLGTVQPNEVHRRVASTFRHVFTTNFDTCLEQAGARHVRHLHGTIDDPASLQNQLYRLGKSARSIASDFSRRIEGRTLVIIGYSLRDDDVRQIICERPPKRIFYLSYDGASPRGVSEIPCRIIIVKGSAQEFFEITGSPKSGPAYRHVRAKLPAATHRINALLRICSRAGLYSKHLPLLNAHLPKLRGRARVLAMCEVADTLRNAGRFSEAEKLTRQVMLEAATRRANNRDVMSTVLTQLGLIALDRGDSSFEEIEFLFRRSLTVFEELRRSEPPSHLKAESDIWRARILNNLGLVAAAKGQFTKSIELYTRSITLKRRHHERYGIAQSLCNRAKAEIQAGQIEMAGRSLENVVTIMRDTPDVRICSDVVIACLNALSDTGSVRIDRAKTHVAPRRTPSWWRRVKTSSRDKKVRRILDVLFELRCIFMAVKPLEWRV